MHSRIASVGGMLLLSLLLSVPAEAAATSSAPPPDRGDGMTVGALDVPRQGRSTPLLAADTKPAASSVRGLVKRRRGPCAGMYLVRRAVGGRPAVCSAGPQPAPRGAASTSRRSIREIRAAFPDRVRRTTAQGPHGIACVGDGRDGYRLQAVYARYAGTADRYAAVAPLIRDYVPVMDQVVVTSAAQTGGERHLRWVTGSDCSLDVANVVIDEGADLFGALAAQGLDAPRRKYLVWLDAPADYCGVGTLYGDDRAGSVNRNEADIGHAAIFEGCWFGRVTPYSVEIHETWHMLGAVQISSPNTSGHGHCTDEHDLMCYADAPGVTMRTVCPIEEKSLLDCGDDDYFHTSPPRGSYLDTHLNTADSVYLVGSLDDPPPRPRVLAATGASTGLRVDWQDVPGEEGYRIECRQEGQPFRTCRSGILAGTTTGLVEPLASFSRYSVRVCAIGAGGTSCGAAVSARTLARAMTMNDSSRGFARTGTGWKRQDTGFKGGSLWRDTATDGVRATATWRASVSPGVYEVLVHVPARHASTRNAHYSVYKATPGTIAQAVDQRRARDSWVSLGRFRFGPVAKVRLHDFTGERCGRDISFDAVRFVPVISSAASSGTGSAPGSAPRAASVPDAGAPSTPDPAAAAGP